MSRDTAIRSRASGGTAPPTGSSASPFHRRNIWSGRSPSRSLWAIRSAQKRSAGFSAASNARNPRRRQFRSPTGSQGALPCGRRGDNAPAYRTLLRPAVCFSVRRVAVSGWGMLRQGAWSDCPPVPSLSLLIHAGRAVRAAVRLRRLPVTSPTFRLVWALGDRRGVSSVTSTVGEFPLTVMIWFSIRVLCI